MYCKVSIQVESLLNHCILNSIVEFFVWPEVPALPSEVPTQYRNFLSEDPILCRKFRRI